MIVITKPFILKAVLYILVLSLCLSIAAAKADYDDWVYPGDTIELDDIVFDIEGPSSGEKVYIRYDNKKVIISKGDCEDTDFYRFCHVNASFDLEDHGKMDYVYDREVYHIHLNITKTGPIMVLKRGIDKSQLTLNEEGVITVDIKNTGIATANSVTYEEEFPANIVIVDYSNKLQVVGNTVKWSGNVMSGDWEKLTFTIKPVGEVDEKLKTNLSYVFNGKTHYKESDELKIKGSKYKSAEKVTVSVTKGSPRLGEEMDFKIIIKSSDSNNNLFIKTLSITIPDEFDLIRSSETLENVNSLDYKWNGTISRSSKKEIELILRANEEGNFNIITEADYQINKLDYKEKINTTLSVTATKVTPKITFGHRKFRNFLEGGSPDYIIFSIKNNDKDIKYYNITAKIDSDFFEAETILLDVILPGGERILKKMEYNAPFLTHDGTYNVNCTGTYKTEAGVEFDFFAKDTLSIKMKNYTGALQIIKTVPENLTKNKIGEIVLKLKNVIVERVDNIIVEDKIGNLMLVSGVNKKRIVSIEPGEEVLVYAYKIKGNTTMLEELETKVYYEYKGNRYELINTSKTKIIEEFEEEEEIEDGQAEVGEQEIPKEKKKGVVRRIIEGIGNFFKRLFKRD